MITAEERLARAKALAQGNLQTYAEEIKKNNPIDTDPDPSPNPGATKLRRYWTRGKGAAKIRWGVSGDFNRCVSHLRKYVTDPKGLCNVYHVAAVGAPPGQGHPGGKSLTDDEIKMQETLLYAQTLKQWSVAEIKNLLDDDIERKDNPMDLEYKNVSVSGVTAKVEDGIVEAFVSVTGVVDNVNDVIEPGAYTKTLAKRTPKGVWAHDWNTPVSKVLDIKELMPGDTTLPPTLADGSPWPKEAGALYVKAQFNLDTQRGRDAYSDVKFYDAQQEWSIGYNVPKGQATVGKNGQRHIKSLELFEFSPVLFGAASNARSKKDALGEVAHMFEDNDEFLTEVKAMLAAEGIEVKDGELTATVPVAPVEVVTAVETPDNPTQATAVVEDPAPEVVVTPEEVVPPVTPAAADATQTTAEQVEEVTNELEELREAADSEVPLSAALVARFKEAHTVLGDILQALVPATAQAKDYNFTETKGMREVMDALIAGSFDAGVLDIIDNGVRALETSVKNLDQTAVATNADALLDEIEFALTSATDPKDQQAFKDLAAAIGTELQNMQNNAPAVADPNTDTGAAATPEPVKEEEKVVTLSVDQLMELKALSIEDFDF